MSITTAQLQQLKRTNISIDAEKTKQRVTELWQSLRIKQKQAIRKLADITAQPIYRTMEVGNMSAKIVVAFAQALNINPLYLTGEADEPGECTDALIRDLLLRHGYRKLAAELELSEEGPAKRKYTRREKPEPEEAPEEVSGEDELSDEDSQPELGPQLPPASGTLTAEDLQQLVFALYVQAKAGIANSKEKLDQIKLILLA
ncbi:MAG: hypothetical protein FWE98_04290 [Oscillospiraceae bacterium]|nr:hypothetical protein [Oscillospiraceae bacterium]